MQNIAKGKNTKTVASVIVGARTYVLLTNTLCLAILTVKSKFASIYFVTSAAWSSG